MSIKRNGEGEGEFLKLDHKHESYESLIMWDAVICGIDTHYRPRNFKRSLK